MPDRTAEASLVDRKKSPGDNRARRCQQLELRHSPHGDRREHGPKVSSEFRPLPRGTLPYMQEDWVAIFQLWRKRLDRQTTQGWSPRRHAIGCQRQPSCGAIHPKAPQDGTNQSGERAWSSKTAEVPARSCRRHVAAGYGPIERTAAPDAGTCRQLRIAMPFPRGSYTLQQALENVCWSRNLPLILPIGVS